MHLSALLLYAVVNGSHNILFYSKSRTLSEKKKTNCSFSCNVRYSWLLFVFSHCCCHWIIRFYAPYKIHIMYTYVNTGFTRQSCSSAILPLYQMASKPSNLSLFAQGPHDVILPAAPSPKPRKLFPFHPKDLLVHPAPLPYLSRYAPTIYRVPPPHTPPTESPSLVPRLLNLCPSTLQVPLHLFHNQITF